MTGLRRSAYARRPRAVRAAASRWGSRLGPQRADSRSLVDEVVEYLRSQPATPGVDGRPYDGWSRRAKVLLPFSGSPAAQRTVEAMVELAPILRSEVRVLHVREFDVGRGGRFSLETREEALALTTAAVARLRRRGITATGVVRAAERVHVHRAIAAEAQEARAAIILLGASRLPSVAGLLRHRFVRKIVRHADCPVMVVHTNDDHGLRRAGSRRPSPGEVPHGDRPAA